MDSIDTDAICNCCCMAWGVLMLFAAAINGLATMYSRRHHL
jgi:hypothetical protein